MNARSRRVCAGLIAGCVAIGSLACASGPVPLGSPVTQAYDASRPSTLSTGACGFMLFALIPFGLHSSLKRAQESLIAQAGNGYVTDVKVGTHWIYAFVGTLHCVDMEATAYPRR